MKHLIKGLVLLVTVLAPCYTILAKTIAVGPTRTYTTPNALSNANLATGSVIVDGDIIEIDAGEYKGADNKMWLSENNLTIRGVGATRPMLNNEWVATGPAGIFVISGNNVLIENLYFLGGKNFSANGAGIRHNGGDLIVRNCKFYYNQMGLQCTSNIFANILIEFCEFDNNGHVGTGMSHHIYANNIDSGSVTLQYSYLHNVHNGNSFKSKCGKNYLYYNRITNEAGRGSSLIDLPRGGLLVCVGNVLQKNATPDGMNRRVIAYASEPGVGPVWYDQHPIKEVHIVNNTVVSDFYFTKFISAIYNTIESGQITNNAFIGDDMLIADGYISGVTSANNYVSNTIAPAGLVDPTNYDYHLTSSSPLIGGATNPGSYKSISLKPVQEYDTAIAKSPRADDGNLDIGAFEYVDKSALTLIEEDLIAQKEMQNSLKVFPNPSSGVINIVAEQFDNSAIVFVKNALGQIVLTQDVKNNKTQLDLGEFESGWYYIEVRDYAHTYIYKVCKK